VVVGDVGVGIVRSVLELDIHPHPKLLDVEWGSRPVDADPSASGAGLLRRELCLYAHAAELTPNPPALPGGGSTSLAFGVAVKLCSGSGGHEPDRLKRVQRKWKRRFDRDGG